MQLPLTPTFDKHTQFFPIITIIKIINSRRTVALVWKEAITKFKTESVTSKRDNITVEVKTFIIDDNGRMGQWFEERVVRWLVTHCTIIRLSLGIIVLKFGVLELRKKNWLSPILTRIHIFVVDCTKEKKRNIIYTLIVTLFYRSPNINFILFFKRHWML